MKIYIYIDVLIVLNIYITYFLLLATSKISHTPLRTARCIAASVTGGLFSLMILIPDVNRFLNFFLKFAVSCVIISVAFGISMGIRNTFRLVVWFYGINFVFAGIILSLRFAFSLSFVKFSNSYFYMDFSVFTLVIFTAVSYGAICLVKYLSDRSLAADGIYRVIIRYNSKTVSIEGVADTGNSLVDFLSGKPVIVCGSNELEKIVEIPEPAGIMEYENYSEILRNFRIIPYSTIGENGIIPVFSPDEILIKEEKTKKIRQADALIGISNKKVKAVFNPKILKM